MKLVWETGILPKVSQQFHFAFYQTILHETSMNKLFTQSTHDFLLNCFETGEAVEYLHHVRMFIYYLYLNWCLFMSPDSLQLVVYDESLCVGKQCLLHEIFPLSAGPPGSNQQELYRNEGTLDGIFVKMKSQHKNPQESA